MSEPPPVAQIAPLLGPIYGSLYFAALMSTAFYGVACMQTFFYYVHYPKDALRTKSLVGILWILNTIHEALCVAGVYKFTMAGLLNPFPFVDGSPELILLYILTATVAVPVQGFFVYRIYIFSKKNLIAPIIWVLLALTQFVGTTVFVSKALYTANGSVHVVSFTELNDDIFVSLTILCLSVATGVDVLIAMFMTYLLLRQRSLTGIASTAHILQRLTVFAVNTGIWTATFALLAIILLHLFLGELLYAVFIIPLCSVYCNTLLANLNVRAYVRGDTTHNVGMDLPMVNPSSRTSHITKDEYKLDRETKLVSSVHVTTEVMTFPDQSTSWATESI